MGERVPIIKTPWGPPWDHHKIVLNMDAILRACGVEEEHVRVRLTAHAIIACGWAQENAYNFNAWKCKRGQNWEGDWYVHDTIEEEHGIEKPELGTKWRAYPSYEAALADYRVWHLKQYAAAKAALLDPSAPDRAFAQGLKDGGYFTGEKGVAVLTSICARARKELGLASPEELEAAAAFAKEERAAPRPFSLAKTCAVLAVLIGAVLFSLGVVRVVKG